MFDLKVINSVLEQMEEERGIPKAKILEAIEMALATAYKKEYGKTDQIIRSEFDVTTGGVTFHQIKIVVDETTVYPPEERDEVKEKEKDDADGERQERVMYNPERHIYIDDARKIKRDVAVGDEITFPLEERGDYGRISSQTAKQVIIQKIREAEKASVLEEYGDREGDIVSGTVQRVERGNIYLDMGRATGLLPVDEQIPSERFRQGERVRGYLLRVEETPKGVFLRVSRSHPAYLEKLFEIEAPEVASGTVEIKAIAREPGSRSKIAIISKDENIDPVGSLVGQRGVRVSTVMSELGGEKIDIIEYTDDPAVFIQRALSPAQIIDVEIIDEQRKQARVTATEDQQSLAIGKGGQNVRLAAKLTGWKVDIKSTKGDELASADEEGVDMSKEGEDKAGMIKDEPEAVVATAEETAPVTEMNTEVASTETQESKETTGDESTEQESEEKTSAEATEDKSSESEAEEEKTA